MKDQPTISLDMPMGASQTPGEVRTVAQGPVTSMAMPVGAPQRIDETAGPYFTPVDQPGQAVPLTAAERIGEETVVRHTVEREQLIPAENRMESTFKMPVVATLVFVITMIAIFYLGRIVAGYYEPVMNDSRVEFVGRSS